MKPVKHRATIICRHGKQTHKWLWVRKPNAAWTLPGGRIEPGETPVQAAERELLEETGLQAESLTLLMRHEAAERMHYVFEAEFADAHIPRRCVKLLIAGSPTRTGAHAQGRDQAADPLVAGV